MKKILLALAFSGVLLGFSGCDGKGKLEGGGSLHCWEFKVSIKYTGTGSDLVDDSVLTYNQCDLNETQAEFVRKNYESTVTTGGLTQTITATKKKTD